MSVDIPIKTFCQLAQGGFHPLNVQFLICVFPNQGRALYFKFENPIKRRLLDPNWTQRGQLDAKYH
jgi:hypothetical protein